MLGPKFIKCTKSITQQPFLFVLFVLSMIGLNQLIAKNRITRNFQNKSFFLIPTHHTNNMFLELLCEKLHFEFLIQIDHLVTNGHLKTRNVKPKVNVIVWLKQCC
jgi:hypothetical protein